MKRSLLVSACLLITTLLPASALAVDLNTRMQNIDQRLDKLASSAAQRLEHMTQKRQEAQTLRTQKETVLKAKFEQFKDQKRTALALKVDQNLDSVNKNRTTAMSKNLENMTMILEKLQTRTDTASASGKDTTTVNTAIVAARAAVIDAQTSVSIQSGKEYTITATTEASLKNDVKTARDKLYNDLKTVHTQVESARKSVISAYQALASILGSGGTRDGK